MKKWEYFSREELMEFVKNSTSLRQVAIKCGYSPDSGSVNTPMKDMIKFYNFDTSHFLNLNGSSEMKDNFDYSRFKKGSAIKSANMKSALVHLKGHKCENCGLEEWQKVEIPLEVHHIDGDSLNNEIDNLKLLCPNCHALTENWRGKNIGKEKAVVSDEEFVLALKESQNIRQALIKLGLAPKGGNYTRAKNLIAQHKIVF